MKTLTLKVFFILSALTAHSQTRQQIKKSWIRVVSQDLSEQNRPLDSSYVRYSFKMNTLNISLEPAGGYVTRDWKLDNQQLIIDPDKYTIDLLNDSALIIYIPGFKRFSFLSEAYLASQDGNLEKIGEFEGKPLYKATNFLTPRFSDTKSFQSLITSNIEQHYEIKRKSLFQASFIVTDKGEIKSVSVEKSIYADYDKDIVKEITKTSKKWTPAYFKGQPVQTKFTFKIQYLDSIVP